MILPACLPAQPPFYKLEYSAEKSSVNTTIKHTIQLEHWQGRLKTIIYIEDNLFVVDKRLFGFQQLLHHLIYVR